jgi:hypothetical protein
MPKGRSEGRENAWEGKESAKNVNKMIDASPKDGAERGSETTERGSINVGKL